VHLETAFDPYKAAVSSTTGGMSTKDVFERNQHKSMLDVQQEEIARLKKERTQAYEGKIENREIEVYNHDSM